NYLVNVTLREELCFSHGLLRGFRRHGCDKSDIRERFTAGIGFVAGTKTRSGTESGGIGWSGSLRHRFGNRAA
ncbi:MAG TPA: hypothetical protein PK384_14285, partial [Candidatus Latescibacteria bacterium]|nr:hypothetical protein [Candidatus Latescibacterota bacterium]